ncbi:MAG: DNA translocase FtsK [Luteitalea sp.]|nr:DNA translocase FtsK [Luteitalea sp.]
MSSSVVTRRLSEVLGVSLFGAAVIWLIALASYSSADPAWFFYSGPERPVANFAGQVGAFLAELSFQSFGHASYLVPFVLVVAGWHYFWCRTLTAGYTKALGALLLITCVAALLSLTFDSLSVGARNVPPGGYLGAALAAAFKSLLNRTGAVVLVITLLFLGVMMVTQMSLGAVLVWTFEHVGAQWRALRDRVQAWRDERRRQQQAREVIRKHIEKGAKPDEVLRTVRRGAATDSPAVALPAEARGEARRGAPPRESAVEARAESRKAPVRISTPSLPLSEPEPITKAPAERRRGDFTLPPLALLDAPAEERKIDERELMEAGRLLEDKCREFAVEGNVVQIHPGPVVTTFEFKPDAGVKYSKVTGLAEDLCLAMRAESVLIDRIPGKSTVGIQIPNAQREQISLRELLESEPYRRSVSKLTLALGKTIHGEPSVADLGTMPHLLIAGSTGAGKSVGLNGMITSILYRATPEEVRFIMIDPKRLELGMYEDIPHLLTPVVVDPKLAANALRWAVREMEERYKTLAAQGVRNVEQFNRNLRHMLASGEAKPDPQTGELPRTLPFVVVIIDELADLMMVASNEVEESICRLAQMARAVGIHLILATQRPSVDVITGLIKANLPARISFRVSSKTDSRTILDCNGAEQLLGKGDMLYLPPASSRVARLHGPYISEQESARLASYLRKQGQPVYDNTITDEEKKVDALGGFDRDDLYDEAARIVVQSGQASISYLQRRLRIGFSRAARLVDMMEADGLVSTGAGGKAREVLVPKDYFEHVDAQVR